ncbi:MAG: restriction endonuclease subunit S, partial [Clostridiales bacterium]|nr:restriction endonuclease subunit S [Clostridiales bacterium]
MLTGIRLKYSILRSAVKGLLVSQNKGDEPASVLIERARVEKSVSEPKGRGRSKVNSVIYRDKDNPKAFYEWANESYVADVTDELPFEIPDSWEWARLGSFARLKAGNTIPDADLMRMQTGGLYPCYGGNGIRGYAETYNREGRYIAIGRQGALCGNIHLFEGKFYATEHCILAMIFGGTSLDWFAYMLEGLDLNNSMSSTAQPGLAVRDLNKVLIPVPPLEEQIRIEEKVRKLLALADEFTECERRRQETDA